MAKALDPFASLLFMESARVLNRRASAKRARWATYIGRPFPKSPTDSRPNPGCYDDEDAELG